MSYNTEVCSSLPVAKRVSESEKNNPLKAEISQFSSFQQKSPSERTTIFAFIHRVRLGSYSEAITKIRCCLADDDQDGADRIKQLLPAVSISGVVLDGPRAKAFDEGRFQHSGFLQGDFDAKEFHPRRAEDIRAILAKDPHIQAAFLSPKNGVKAIIRIPICQTPQEHKSAFLAAESYFQEKYELKLDASTKDPIRLCYVSSDPDAFQRTAPAIPLAIPAKVATARVSMANSAGQPRKVNTTKKHKKLTPEEIRRMLACIPPRPDYDAWLKISSAVWAATEDEEIGTELLKEWSPEEEPGEYSEKFKSRLTEITAGTLVMLAREHGSQSPHGGSDTDSVEIPDNVFPVPCGEIEYSKAGEIIFSAIGPQHRLFTRSGSVQEIVDDGNEPAYFSPVTPERFCSLIENFGYRVARRELQKAGEGSEEGKFIWRGRRMPVSAAKILLCADAASAHLPPVRQLVACPILTREGTIIGRGYHAHAGGTYVSDGDILPDMPVDAAREAILSLLEDFNFVTPSDKSRAVASFLSPALKMGGWIEEDFPMDMAEADQSQTGKTYRQKLVSRVYNEIPSAIAAPRGGVGSLDESVSNALIKGRPFIILDNFRGKLDSTILELAIRGNGRVSCRALRKDADVDTRPFNWQMSTNGAELTRDMANRSIITRLRKQPQGYKFKDYPEGDLLSHVAKRQVFYLGAVFSIIKEWARQGRLKTEESRHDFREWCRSLDWIVQHLFGLAPLLDGHLEEQARTANPNLQWLRDVVMAAARTKQLGRTLTTAQLVSIAEDDGIEFPGNPQSREEPYQRAGRLLAKLFKEGEGNSLNVDGFVVAREERIAHIEGRGYEKQKTYIIQAR